MNKHSLTDDNYYQDTKYLSNSTVSEYMECSARAEAKRKGEWKDEGFKLPFAMGHFFESLLNGDSKRVIESAEFKDQLCNANNVTENANAIKCRAMYARCSENDLFMRFNTGLNEQIFTGEIHGVLFRIKVDIVNIANGFFTDTKSSKATLKTCINEDGEIALDYEDFDWKDGKKRPFYEHFDYIMQLAIYQEILRQNFDVLLQPILNVASKVKPFRYQTLFIDKHDERLSDKIELLGEYIEYIESMRAGTIEPTRCEESTCEYCNQTFNPELPIVI
ncbi:MAG: hypothetical protein DRH97_00425 [Chloroflexi bacterium]|nr:MAG: hypothetical protein DRH97_00425 [Chloroflexota bacterium]